MTLLTAGFEPTTTSPPDISMTQDGNDPALAADDAGEPCCSEENPHHAIPTITDRPHIARHWFDEAQAFPTGSVGIEADPTDSGRFRQGRGVYAVGNRAPGVAALAAAVNLAPHWQRVAEAARDIADRSPTDVDGEGLGGEWCHWCERQTDGANRPRHEEWCDFAALQTALAALDAAREAL